MKKENSIKNKEKEHGQNEIMLVKDKPTKGEKNKVK